MCFLSQKNGQYLSKHWKQVKDALQSTVTAMQNSMPCKSRRRRVSLTSVSLCMLAGPFLRMPHAMSGTSADQESEK